MTMWMPDGWWIITEVNNKGVRFTAGANGLPVLLTSGNGERNPEVNSK
jgi:hypothetical protein